MSLRLPPASLRALRGLGVVAVVSAAATAYTPATYRYHSFFAGVTLGLLLVLTVMLFRAHAAEVEELPANPPDRKIIDKSENQE